MKMTIAQMYVEALALPEEVIERLISEGELENVIMDGSEIDWIEHDEIQTILKEHPSDKLYYTYQLVDSENDLLHIIIADEATNKMIFAFTLDADDKVNNFIDLRNS